jgi:hypothetical protein
MSKPFRDIGRALKAALVGKLMDRLSRRGDIRVLQPSGYAVDGCGRDRASRRLVNKLLTMFLMNKMATP